MGKKRTEKRGGESEIKLGGGKKPKGDKSAAFSVSILIRCGAQLRKYEAGGIIETTPTGRKSRKPS